ncbi:hypothetical protein [Deinococcus sp.]|uniref:hypothetical protein n=1 Tax=Deinococcus sp. TaxID=47478 RepID=UPI003CC6ADD2
MFASARPLLRSLSPAGSSLARPLDLRLPSNRLALTGTLGFLGLALLLRRPWKEVLGTGGSAFLGWAIGRELDPDHPGTAALALGLAGTGSVFGPANTRSVAQLVPGFAALGSLRLLVGTVGLAPALPDLAALSLQAGLAGVGGTRSAALLPAAALGLSSTQGDALSPPGSWGLAALGVGLLAHRRGAQRSRSVFSDLLSLAVLGLGSGLVAPETPTSACDQAPRKVAAQRLHAARALSLGTLALGLLRGESGRLIPLAAAALGTSLRRLQN